MPGNAVVKLVVMKGRYRSIGLTSGNEAVTPSKFVCVQSRVGTGTRGGILFSGLSAATGHNKVISNWLQLTISIHIVDPMRNTLFH